MQEEADALASQLEAAMVDFEAAKAEQSDIYAQWDRDQEDLGEEIRCA